MNQWLAFLIILTMIIPQKYAFADSSSDPNEIIQLQNLSDYAKRRVPSVYALDSLFNRKLSKITVSQIVSEQNNHVPVQIQAISPNGVLTPEEKLKFWSIVESEGKQESDITSGKVEVIFFHHEDIQRAHAAKEIRKNLGKEVLLVEVPESMSRYFRQITEHAEKSFFKRSFHSVIKNVSNSAVFLKDIVYSGLSLSLKGEFKKYIDTVYVRPSQKDDRMALAFAGLQGGFSSAIFWGINMPVDSFLGFLSTGLLTTLVLSRNWRTISNVFKTDIQNPFKYAPMWREIFARLLVITGGTTFTQYSIASYLESLKYLPTIPTTLGNILTTGLGEAYYSTNRNRILSTEASPIIALYSYILFSLPFRAITQYSQSIDFSTAMPGGTQIEFVWNLIRNYHLDFGIMEFTGTSIFVFGSYGILTQLLKWKAQSAEKLAEEGFFKFLLKPKSEQKSKKDIHNINMNSLTERRLVDSHYISADDLVRALIRRNSQPASSCLSYFY